ncbi:hypothetical protein HALLA_12280 [Halostagnicola larsenii XH-48]|uniref:Uncharacterized protein n=1 Tax=Halostagnicola larsenii XH-48 TaxID=797299 RepID=W0JQJ8_9EURY|nr:DUF5805 domain-containing protein [Halostagnicola larsenii]AHF99444.1 hypothetical protein HALLA_12280 [Halostagnicola larsenii XH-48]
MEESVETTRKSVKTYVPEYQKDEWQSHAEELGMSQSEFVRTMVQAGRKGFDSSLEQPRSGDANPGGNGLETRVLELLSSDTYSWDELLETIGDDIEARLEETLSDLQDENRIRYSGRHGGYTVIEDTDGN